MEKFGAIVIYLIATIALIPPLFYFGGIDDGKYFDNIFFTILFLSLTCICVLIPFILEKMPIYVKRISLLFSGWFLNQFIFEVANFSVDDLILENASEYYYYAKYLLCFVLGTTIVLIHQSWISTNQKK